MTDNIDDFLGKLNQAADIVTEKLIDIAPEAAEGLLNLVQAKGIFDIAVGLLIAIPLAILCVFCLRMYRDSGRVIDQNGWDIPEGDVQFTMILMFVVSAGIGIVTLSIRVVNFYNLVAAFYPEGAIALKALEAVGVEL